MKKHRGILYIFLHSNVDSGKMKLFSGSVDLDKKEIRKFDKLIADFCEKAKKLQKSFNK